DIVKGEVVIVRYVGPKGGTGMTEMLSLSSLSVGKERDEDVALLTDGRFSGSTHGLVVGHITPERQDGGNVPLIQKGDNVTIDQDTKELSFNVSDEVLEERRKDLVLPPLHSKGVLGKYAHIVSSSSKGAITDFFNREDLPGRN